MPTRPTTRVIEHLRRAVLLRDGAGPRDGELLGRFIDRRDEAAFAALVKRHGPMVWGVCRRLLGHHDAEDAFQATFLVLVKKVASVVPSAMVGNWLYGVAHQTALHARRTAARRRGRERQVAEMPEPAVIGQDLWCDLRPLLDGALSRLPDRYRVVIVLCDLEGKTRREAARQLGVPEGTVAGRLARARVMLAKRLARHGLAPSGGMLAAALSREVASASVPVSVASATIRAACRFAAGQAVGGLVPATAATLTVGVLKAMSMARFKTTFLLMAVAGVLCWGGGVVVWQTQARTGRADPLVELPAAEPVPDLCGTWQGDGWGTVVLRRAKEARFEGTYTDTFGKDVGRIAVRWTRESRRYEGTWGEGRFRFGRIALEAAKAGDAISGAWTTDPKCEHQPGVPSLASLRWSRVRPLAPPTPLETPAPMEKPPPSASRGPQPTAATERTRFQGTWVLISSERNGQATSEEKNPYTLTFTGDKWKVHRGDDVAVEGTLRFVDVAANPRKFDLLKHSRLGPGSSADYGIYEWKGDRLRYCTRNGPLGFGIDTPDLRPRDFTTRDGDGRTLYLWKRARPAAKARTGNDE
jgi:RNA polymerase sigma factor (sigma-70 family)